MNFRRPVVKREYDPLIKQRWILQPRVDLNWYGQEDALRGIGIGLSSAEAALRLRYEIRRRGPRRTSGSCASAKYGGSADFAEAAGEYLDDTRLVAGVRVRF